MKDFYRLRPDSKVDVTTSLCSRQASTRLCEIQSLNRERARSTILTVKHLHVHMALLSGAHPSRVTSYELLS